MVLTCLSGNHSSINPIKTCSHHTFIESTLIKKSHLFGSQSPLIRSLPPQQRIGLILAVVLVVLIMAGLSFILLVSMAREWLVWLQFQSFGETMQATVEARDEGSEGEKILRYEYTVGQARTPQKHFSQSEEVGSYLFNLYEPGSPITIVYLPGRPWVSRIEGHYYERNFYSASWCWWNVCVSVLVILALSLTRSLPKELILPAITGGVVMLIVTLAGWLVELAAGEVGIGGLLSGGIIGTAVGVVFGLVAAILARLYIRQMIDSPIKSDGQTDHL